MEIIALTGQDEDTCCMCLEEWSDAMAEAGDDKKTWLEKKKQQGLRLKAL
ncbi:MAG: hypothetical protein IPP94_13955 [Ignavibacteria bacterium]|nr:hypothetical protein [Ignavibacteria bacterium]